MKKSILTLCRAFGRDETGAAATEYALIAGGLAITVVASVELIGFETKTTFDNVATSFPPAP